MLRGMRKKLMMVARISSGTCWERCFIMLGQKMPTANSKPQKAASWILPAVEMPALQRLLQALTWCLLTVVLAMRGPRGSTGQLLHASRQECCLTQSKAPASHQ